jgi:D-alanine-D-alanine ligase
MRKRIIGIVYNEPTPLGHAFSEASIDVMVQVQAVEEALEELGHATVRIPFTWDVGGFIQRLNSEGAEMIFNLCETVDEDARFSGHPAAVFELLRVPFSGSSSMALMLTTDKFVTNRLLKANGIATPRCAIYNTVESAYPSGLRYPVIVKPRLEDASIGIDQESIFENEQELKRRIGGLCERFGSLLIEEYIEGREFNISLFGYPSARSLPAAEIDFSDFPQGVYPIVGYRAKWDETSFEYHHTPRKFPHDIPPFLLRSMERTALKCARVLMLRDYGRVDMRVDGNGKVQVLEVNANPCLSPDAGFAAAIEEAGTTYSQMVGCLVSFMAQRVEKHGLQACRLSRQR